MELFGGKGVQNRPGDPKFTRPDMPRVKNGFIIIEKSMWTQDPILNRHETPDPKSTR